MRVSTGRFVATLLTLAIGQPAWAESDLIPVPSLLPAAELNGLDPGVALTQPSHGRLEAQPGKVLFYPADSFWAVGMDSFEYKTGSEISRVMLVPERRELTAWTGFEVGDPEWAAIDNTGRLVVDAQAALSGERGLRVASGDAPGYVEYYAPGNFYGNGQQGTGTSIKIRLPAPDPLNVLAEAFTTLAELGEPDDPAVRLMLNRTGSLDYALRIEARGRTPVTVALSPGPHDLALVWGRSGGGPDIDVLLRVDEMRVITIRAATPAPPGSGAPPPGLVRQAFGSISENTGRWPFDLDEIRIESGNPGLASEVVASSDFERDAEPWVQAGSGPRLSPEAALGGTRGLLMPLGPQERGEWRTTVPDSETVLGMRFDLRLGTGAHVPGAGLELAGASSSDETTLASDVFSLRLASKQGTACLEALAWGDEGGAQPAGCAPIERGVSHVVELQWRAGGPAHDGRLRLWLDGNLAGQREGIAAQAQRVESLWLGVRGTGDASGRLAIDDVLVWRPVAPR